MMGDVYVQPRKPLSPDEQPIGAASVAAPPAPTTPSLSLSPDETPMGNPVGVTTPPPPPPESWQDWATRNMAENWQKASTAKGTDWLKASADDLSLGAAGPIVSYLTGRPLADVRKEFAASQEALGPIARTGLAGATYLAPGMGLAKVAKIAAPLGGLGMSMAEGGLYGGLDSYFHGNSAWETAKNALYGAGGGAAGRAVAEGVVAPVVRKVGDWASGLPGRSADTIYDLDRTAMESGSDKSAQSVAANAAEQQAFAPKGSPEARALQDVKTSAMRPTDPGLPTRAAGLVAGGLAAYPVSHMFGSVPGLSEIAPIVGAGVGTYGVSAPVKAIRSWDRNITTQYALDKLYEATQGAPITNRYTQPWADALRQIAIGGSGRTN